MKKVLITLTGILATVFVAQAQSSIVASHSEAVVETPRKSPLKWIARAGIGLMDVAGEYSGDSKMRAGYDFSVAFERPVSNRGFVWGMDLGLVSRGMNADSGRSRYMSGSLVSHAIRFSPTTFGYSCGLGGDWRLAVHAGAYMSVDYSGRLSVSVYDRKASVGISDMNDAGMKYQRFDVGLAMGGGFWCGHVNIDVTWYRGFVSMFEAMELFTNSVALRLGYAF